MPDPTAHLPPLSTDNIVRATITAAADLPPNATGQQAIDFTLLRVAGEGGMGIVYRALQHYPQRTVALKILKSSVASPGAAKRFRREIGVLARLNHPGIAQLFCVGATNPTLAGQSTFIAMEFIDGVPLTTYAADRSLDLRSRLRLILKVCDALTYLHQQFIIHRDLKPNNILVDAQGNPKLIDFGLAWIIDSDSPATLLTQAGELVGTLEYMSPEQAAADNQEINAQTDIYALGIMLYELLAGRRPFSLTDRSLVDAALAIATTVPDRLSSHNPAFAGDLEMIVHKAIQKDRAQRYKTIAAFAEDLRRFLDHRPILARAPSVTYRAGKFVRRHALLVSAVAALLLVLSIASVLALYQQTRLRHEAQQTAIANRQADIRLTQTDLAQGDALALTDNPQAARESYERAYVGLEHLGLSTRPAALALWQLNLIAALPLRIVQPHVDTLSAVTLSPDFHDLALAFSNFHIQVHDLATNATTLDLPAPRPFFQRTDVRPAAVDALHFSPRRTTLALFYNERWAFIDLANGIAYGSRDSSLSSTTAQYADDRSLFAIAADGSPTRIFPPDGRSQSLSFPAIGPLLAFATTTDGGLFVDDTTTLFRWTQSPFAVTPLKKLETDTPDAIAFSPDASTVAIPNVHSLSLLNTTSLQETAHLDLAPSERLLGFGSPTTLLLANSQRPVVRIVDFAGNSHGIIVTPSPNLVAIRGCLALHLDPRKDLLLSALLHDAQCRPLTVGAGTITAIALSADASRAAFAIDQNVRILETTHNALVHTRALASPAVALELNDAGTTLTVTTQNNHLQQWNITTGLRETDAPFAATDDPPPPSPALLAEDNALTFLDPADHHPLRTIPFPFRLAAIAPDAQHALLISPDNVPLFLDFTLPDRLHQFLSSGDVAGALHLVNPPPTE